MNNYTFMFLYREEVPNSNSSFSTPIGPSTFHIGKFNQKLLVFKFLRKRIEPIAIKEIFGLNLKLIHLQKINIELKL